MFSSLSLPKFSLPRPTHLHLVKALPPVCALSLLLLPLPSRAGQWVVTYTNTGTSSVTPFNPFGFLPASVHHWPAGSSGGGIGDSDTVDATASGSVTATLTWVPAQGQTSASDPPPTVPVSIAETGTAKEYPDGWYGSGPAPLPGGSADNGLGDSPLVNGRGYLSTGTHLIQKDGSSGTITLDPVTLSASVPTSSWVVTGPPDEYGVDGQPDWFDGGSAGVNLVVQVDPYKVILDRDGARGETQDPDGTVHGDTIYSYGDYINTEDTGLEKRTDYLNWQTFHPNLIGNWTFPQGPSPYWAWTPSESDDTNVTGKVSMHYRNYYTLEGEPRGTDDAPETRTVSYSVTDPLGATATANYILTVHDPNEVGPDTFTRGIENLRMAPNAAYGRSTVDGSPVTVYAEQSDSWSLGISSDVPWVLLKLGLNASASYTYSYNAGVQCVLPNVQAGYGTYLEEFDSYKYHTGTITQWDAGGYVGTHPYHVKEPDRPSGGYQAHTPAVSLPDGGVH